MDAFMAGESYLALFIVSFLAATVIPLGSEWLLVSMVLSGSSIPLSVITASSGNYLGGVSTWLIGLLGSAFLIRKVLKIDENKAAKARAAYEKYGSWSLLFSWLPVVGDPICLAGGMMRVGFVRFTLFVLTGKVARYSAVAWIAKEGASLVKG